MLYLFSTEVYMQVQLYKFKKTKMTGDEFNMDAYVGLLDIINIWNDCEVTWVKPNKLTAGAWRRLAIGSYKIK